MERIEKDGIVEMTTNRFDNAIENGKKVANAFKRASVRIYEMIETLQQEKISSIANGESVGEVEAHLLFRWQLFVESVKWDIAVRNSL